MARLDQVLVERGICPSREQARRAILAGQVRLNDRRAAKPSETVRPTDTLLLLEPARYVSRGGHKLEHALKTFATEVTGLTVVDLGASTGGFTDCLLQQGASRVYAVDVGRGLLAWKLRQNPRVIVREKINARTLTAAQLGPDFQVADLVTVDCSFISLRLVLAAAAGLLREGGQVIALVKPQFEAGKAEADRGAGVITDPRVHQRVLAELQAFVSHSRDLVWLTWTESPLLGPAGNKEFLALLEKIRKDPSASWPGRQP